MPNSSSQQLSQQFDNAEIVTLKCEKVNGKLRIRVYNNPNYHPNVNCQFPREIRREGQYYSIEGPLGVAQTNNSMFYRAMNKSTIKNITKETADQLTANSQSSNCVQNNKPNNIYSSDSEECVVCLENKKNVIFSPCGHYYCCDECYNNLPTKKCPICRTQIAGVFYPDSNLGY